MRLQKRAAALSHRPISRHFAFNRATIWTIAPEFSRIAPPIGAIGTVMARKSSLDSSKLLDAIAAEPEGAGIEAIQAVFPTIPRRNLRRHVAGLVAAGRLLRAEGNARALRYHAVAA